MSFPPAKKFSSGTIALPDFKYFCAGALLDAEGSRVFSQLILVLLVDVGGVQSTQVVDL